MDISGKEGIICFSMIVKKKKKKKKHFVQDR